MALEMRPSGYCQSLSPCRLLPQWRHKRLGALGTSGQKTTTRALSNECGIHQWLCHACLRWQKSILSCQNLVCRGGIGMSGRTTPTRGLSWFLCMDLASTCGFMLACGRRNLYFMLIFVGSGGMGLPKRSRNGKSRNFQMRQADQVVIKEGCGEWRLPFFCELNAFRTIFSSDVKSRGNRSCHYQNSIVEILEGWKP